jgi:hypothetical protein
MVTKRRMVAVAGALALGACGSSDPGSPVPSTSGAPGADPSTTVAATTTTPVSGPAVSRPGPPAAGRCSVTVDAPHPPATEILVRSGLPATAFLVRASGGSTVVTGSGTTDGTGSGSTVLDVAGVPPGIPTLVEVSVGGGAEECSVTFGGTP